VIPIDSEADLRFDRADHAASAVALDEAAESLRAALRDLGHAPPPA
jgi:hypothetical protein